MQGFIVLLMLQRCSVFPGGTLEYDLQIGLSPTGSQQTLGNLPGCRFLQPECEAFPHVTNDDGYG
jgi:hypothetical protein